MHSLFLEGFVQARRACGLLLYVGNRYSLEVLQDLWGWLLNSTVCCSRSQWTAGVVLLLDRGCVQQSSCGAVIGVSLCGHRMCMCYVVCFSWQRPCEGTYRLGRYVCTTWCVQAGVLCVPSCKDSARCLAEMRSGSVLT